MTSTMRIAKVTFATAVSVAGPTGIMGAGGHDGYDDDQDG